MRIAICEDSAADQAFLCTYIREYCARNSYRCDIETFDSGEALLAALEEDGFHALLLDIYLPGISGMELARKVRADHNSCAIVFLTVSLDHALEGFGVAAASYVVKPLEPEKLDRALDTCRALFEAHSRVLEVPVAGGVLSLPLSRIRYAEVFGKYTLFHMAGDTVEARISLDRVEEALGGPPFLRCHRSYLVNMNYVDGIGEREFGLRGAGTVPIRKHGGREVRLALARFRAGFQQVEG